MGTPVPPDWPDLIMDKWYAAFVQVHWQPGGPRDCTMLYIGLDWCCRTGQMIADWLGAARECEGGWELCVVSGFTAQRLVRIIGPYDTIDECFMAHI